MKLATFNLNGVRARLPRFLEWLEREKADIVCLQELKCADAALPIADIEAAGYGAVWHGQKGFNGVAILVRGDTPKLRRTGLPGDPDDNHSRYIEAETADGLVVASLYLPNGNPVGTEKFDYKIRWMERLASIPPDFSRRRGRSCSPATGTWCRRIATFFRFGRRCTMRSCSPKRASPGAE
jgi:exodeoxyribonuclease III